MVILRLHALRKIGLAEFETQSAVRIISLKRKRNLLEILLKILRRQKPILLV